MFIWTLTDLVDVVIIALLAGFGLLYLFGVAQAKLRKKLSAVFKRNKEDKKP